MRSVPTIADQARYHLEGLNVEGLPREWFEKILLQQTTQVGDDVAKGSNIAVKEPRFLETIVDLSFSELREAAKSCKRCRLCDSRTNVVFGAGKSERPAIAFVGEGPGADEDSTGEPFVGEAGQLLTAAIEKGLGMRREDVYICNVVKCRPPENRVPLPDEMASCSHYLYRQLELVNPKVIVTLGQTPQIALSGQKLGITKLRGRWLKWRDFPLMPTFHPAYLLRNPPMKKPFWEDLKAVMKYLETA